MAIRTTVDGQTFDELIGGTEVAILTANITLLAGGNYKRGSVLGKITESGKYKLVDKAATDGSQIADMILSDNADAIAADTIATAYVSGIFNREKLTVADGDAVDAHEEELRDKNIYLTKLM